MNEFTGVLKNVFLTMSAVAVLFVLALLFLSEAPAPEAL